MDLPSIEKLIGVMHRERALRIRAGDVEVELHPSAFAAPVAPDGPTPRDVDRCECTHSLSVEHSEMGCLKGCDAVLCARTGGSPPEAQA